MREEVTDWLVESDADLSAARHLIAAHHFSNAVFWAHQSVEKALKAAHIQLRRDTPPQSHGLRALAKAVFVEPPAGIWDGLADLAPHYTQTQYPTALVPRPSEYYTRHDAERALTTAEEVTAWVKERIREKR